ncbi:MAG: Na+/H+ antiporter NhaC family protein, partial [Bacilli bacterium]
MEGFFWSVVPALCIIIAIFLTRSVMISLSLGILIGSFIVMDGQFFQTLQLMIKNFISLFYVDGGLNYGNLSILCFLLLLGVLTGLITFLGGNAALANWSKKRISSKRSASMTIVGVGLTLFPDDVFNMFSTGQLAKPLADGNGISRQKVAYFLHSTSDPLCVLTPISSWGAYIISILSMIISTQSLDNSGLHLFLQIAPFNFYAISSILFVLAVAWWGVSLGKMKEAEEHCSAIAFDESTANNGKLRYLFLPLGTLILTSVGWMLFTGIVQSGSFELQQIFAHAEISEALIVATLCSIVVTCGLMFAKPSICWRTLYSNVVQGMHTTLPAIQILLLAWMVSSLTEQLQTGKYIADLVVASQFDVRLLPVALFLITGVMAFATGTSWGTFAIMLPIGAQIILQIDSSVLPVILAAVLSGSLFGDHCSPISDTTTVAAAASGCTQFQHFETVIYYA